MALITKNNTKIGIVLPPAISPLEQISYQLILQQSGVIYVFKLNLFVAFFSFDKDSLVKSLSHKT